MRFYVSMTWDDWPDGGSFAEIFEADGPEAAECMCREAMAEHQRRMTGDDGETVEAIIQEYADDWHVVDCFLVDNFVREHGPVDV